jgi:hypothetical protein
MAHERAGAGYARDIHMALKRGISRLGEIPCILRIACEYQVLHPDVHTSGGSGHLLVSYGPSPYLTAMKALEERARTANV